jgi:hypothetical protein
MPKVSTFRWNDASELMQHMMVLGWATIEPGCATCASSQTERSVCSVLDNQRVLMSTFMRPAVFAALLCVRALREIALLHINIHSRMSRSNGQP